MAVFAKSLLVTAFFHALCLFEKIFAGGSDFLQHARIDVITSIGLVNISVPGVVLTTGSVNVPDVGIVGPLVGSRTGLDGCFSPSVLPSNHSVNAFSFFADSFVAFVQKNKCNFLQLVEKAQATGFSAVVVYDRAYLDTVPTGVTDEGLQNLTIPVVHVTFLDGRQLWQKIQSFTDAYVVITANNGTTNSATILPYSAVSSTQSSDVGNVLLGFIPAVSYICIVLSVILIIIARRFIHCSLFVVYKMAMHHNPKVAPVPPVCTGSKSDLSSISRCTICLEEFKANDTIHAILPCQHVFHQLCIDQWLRKGKLVCPLCRRKITLKKIICHVFLNHDGQKNGSIFVIPTMCRPTRVSESTMHMQTYAGPT